MIVVIADDITGAAEIAGICIRYGLNTNFCVDEVPSHSDAEVLVIATDSRSLSESEAVNVHLQIARKVADLSPEFIFKKCDSVLRGHVCAETKALYDTFGISGGAIVPVNPTSGRCIRQGKYYIHNVLLHETGFAEDPDFPATSSSVIKLLFKNRKELSNSFEIPDCENESALTILADKYSCEKLFTGSSAWFHEVLLHQKKLTRKSPGYSNKLSGPFVVINGSLHPSGIETAAKFKDKYAVEILPVNLFHHSVSEAEIENYREYLIRTFIEKKGIFIFQNSDILQITHDVNLIIMRTLEIVSPLLNHELTENILITGGATAYSVLKGLQWNILIPDSEIAPGVLCMTIAGFAGKKLILKPGSYQWGIEF